MYLSMKLGSSAAVAATIFRLSSSSPSAVKTLRLGQCSMLSSNHSPSHHSGSSSRSSGATPREMRSAGFFFPEMWFQWQFSVKRWILATRLATNVVQVAGTPASQRITISESVQKKDFRREMAEFEGFHDLDVHFGRQGCTTELKFWNALGFEGCHPRFGHQWGN
uniref:(northern house mosquito) hypothetical protein n=1 Tax=Culex pipiens TaxID=7175 RepID=A0A8D8FM85_CULPI